MRITGSTFGAHRGFCRRVCRVSGDRIQGGRVLEDAHPDPWARVVAAFESGLTEEDALVQARLRILRVDDYDFEEAQPILWARSEWRNCRFLRRAVPDLPQTAQAVPIVSSAASAPCSSCAGITSQ